MQSDRLLKHAAAVADPERRRIPRGAGCTAAAEGGDSDDWQALYYLRGAAFACAAPSIAQERFDSRRPPRRLSSMRRTPTIRAVVGHFGPRAKETLTSGDAAQDRAEQTEFARLARTKHSLKSPRQPESRHPRIATRTGRFRFHCPHQGQMELRRLRTRSRCMRGVSAPMNWTPSRSATRTWMRS